MGLRRGVCESRQEVLGREIPKPGPEVNGTLAFVFRELLPPFRHRKVPRAALLVPCTHAPHCHHVDAAHAQHTVPISTCEHRLTAAALSHTHTHTQSPLRIIGSQHGCVGRDLKDHTAPALLWARTPQLRLPRTTHGLVHCRDGALTAPGSSATASATLQKAPPHVRHHLPPGEAVLAVSVLCVP